MEILDCAACPLRSLPAFTEHSSEEVELIKSIKLDQIDVKADRPIIHEGQVDAPLYTLFSGWAFRFKTLSDGRRQILNFLLPGDFIGVQQRMSASSIHGVQALTAVNLCVFRRDILWELHRRAPRLAFDVTWLTAHEESTVDDTLLSVGRRSAEERIATLLVLLYKRAAILFRVVGRERSVPFPLTQQHIADGLGLSLVHTNKTLRKLEKRGMHRIVDGRLELRDPAAMLNCADLLGEGPALPRPLI